MADNIVEELREASINRLFTADVFASCFLSWEPTN